MKILTITLNPAFDIHCEVPQLIPSHEHLAKITSRDVGGKGINISRVLTVGGVSNSALVVIGNESGNEFSRCLSREGIKHYDFVFQGRVRENITVHTEDGSETRISFSDSIGTDAIWQQVEDRLFSLIENDTIVTFTGRIPDGIPFEAVKKAVLKLGTLGVKVVIDSKSFEKSDLIECKPWLIKPNQEEVSQYAREEIDTQEKALSIATEFHKLGVANVMISLGEQGSVLVCEQGRFVAEPPPISAISTVGAGDSTIAGFLIGVAQSFSPRDCLQLAVAYGTASCLTAGTGAPEKEAVARILSQTKVKRINE